MNDADLDTCMELLQEGIRKHQLSMDDIPELVERLACGAGFISDEMGFELVAGRLRVSLHDQDAWCDPGDFLEAICGMDIDADHLLQEK